MTAPDVEPSFSGDKNDGMTKVERLTPRQQRFVDEYLLDLNGTLDLKREDALLVYARQNLSTLICLGVGRR